MCWSTYPRIPMPSSRHPSFGLSSIGSSTAGSGQHQSFSFPILSFCLWSMRGTSRKPIEAESHSDDNVSTQTFLCLFVFSWRVSTGFFQRAIHRPVHCVEIPLSRIRVDVFFEHGPDLIGRHAGHAGIDPTEVDSLLSLGESKVKSVHNSNSIGLLLPCA